MTLPRCATRSINYTPKASTPRPFRLQSDTSPSPDSNMARGMQNSPRLLPGLATSWLPRAATPRPSRCTSGRSPSPRRRWVPTTPTSAVAQQPGRALSGQGRYAEAEPLLQAVARHREKALGPDHPRSLRLTTSLATTWPLLILASQGRYCRGRAAVPARPHCHPREGARPRPALMSSHPEGAAQQPGRRLLPSARAATPRPSRCTSAASPSARRRWGPTTPMSAPRSTTWPSCIAPRAATPRPSRCTSAASPSARRRWAPTTPMSAPSLNNLAELYRRPRAATPRPSRCTSAPRHPREGAGPRPPRCRHCAQQPGRAVSSPGPLRRGRAALQARAGHPREGAGARPPRCRHQRSTTWPCCTRARAATPRPSRCTSARSPSPRRRWAPTTRCRQSLNNLAELYRAQGRYAEAEPLYKRASPSARRRWAPTIPMSALAEQPGRAVRKPGPLRRGRAAATSAPRHPREGAGPRPPRCRHRRSTTWPCCTASQGRYAEAEPLYKRASPSARRRWVPTTPMSAPRSTTWPCCIAARAATPRPSRCTSARSPSREGAGARPSRCRHPLNNLAGLYQSQGRYAEAEPLYKRALGHRREGAGPRPPRRRHLAQQPGRALFRATRLGARRRLLAAQHGRYRPARPARHGTTSAKP